MTGDGYDPTGDTRRRRGQGGGLAEQAPEGPLEALLATVALCNNATLERTERRVARQSAIPTEGALLTLAAKGGVSREEVVELAPGRQGAALRQRSQADDDHHARRERARDRALEGQRRRPPPALRGLRRRRRAARARRRRRGAHPRRGRADEQPGAARPRGGAPRARPAIDERRPWRTPRPAPTPTSRSASRSSASSA